MAPHEPIIEAPVIFAEPKLEGEDIQEDVSDDEDLPPIAPRPPVTIEAEAREVAPEPTPAKASCAARRWSLQRARRAVQAGARAGGLIRPLSTASPRIREEIRYISVQQVGFR